MGWTDVLHLIICKNEARNILTTAKVCTSYPSLEESGAIDLILPKKESATIAKL